MSDKNLKKTKGFTLVELLVTTAIMGLLAIVSANIISSVLKSQNKTTMVSEVRQNGDLVIAKFERDVKQAQSIMPTGVSRSITLDVDGTNVDWACTDEVLVPATSGVFTRATQVVTNVDPERGVSVYNCNFNVSDPNEGVPQIVQLEFNLRQGVAAPGRAEFEVDEPFHVTVGTRSYTTK
jgi:prepilin-type N-terminal cleavage/methylation domain-containing protein